MNLRPLLVATLAVSFAIPGISLAKPTEDCAKTKEIVRLESSQKNKFSKFHQVTSKASKSYYGGGYYTARRILERALADSQYVSNYRAVNDIEYAVRSARRECEDVADQFVRILDIYSRGYKNIYNTSDKVAIMRGGLSYLTRSNPTVMSRDILSLGISMTAPALNTYNSACEVFDRILQAAKRETNSEGKREWTSLIKFAVRASDNLYHFQTKYALQSRVARAIVDSRPNEAVYLKTLSLITSMNLHNYSDQVMIIEMGLKEYSSNVPFTNHREVTRYLVDAGRNIYSNSAKVSMFRMVMGNLVGLDADKTPAAKVVLRAGLQMSTCRELNNSQRFDVAKAAVNRALKNNMPSFAARTLRDGLSESSRIFDSYRRVRVIRNYMERALR